MTTSLSTVAGLSVSANLTNTLNVGGAAANLATTFGLSLTNGTAAGQGDVTFWDHRTLDASGSETLDLAGSLSSPFGATITFARVKLLLVSADASNTNNVNVGGAASNGMSTMFGAANDIAVVRPGATLAWITGVADAVCYAVTAGTGDLLQIANSSSGTAVSYTVIVIGASA